MSIPGGSARIWRALRSGPWHKLIFASGPAEERLYDTAVLTTHRDRSRRTDIWMAVSQDYARLKTISGKMTGKQSAWASAARQIQPATWRRLPGCCMSNLPTLRAARHQNLDSVEIEDSKLYFARTKLVTPDVARVLSVRLWDFYRGCASLRCSLRWIDRPALLTASRIWERAIR